jgi:hypothetical protein
MGQVATAGRRKARPSTEVALALVASVEVPVEVRVGSRLLVRRRLNTSAPSPTSSKRRYACAKPVYSASTSAAYSYASASARRMAEAASSARQSVTRSS